MEHHKISEYISNLQFKKTLCMGIRPNEVYEVICNLTSMYNELLSESYEEVERLKGEIELLSGSKGLCETEDKIVPSVNTSDKEEPAEYKSVYDGTGVEESEKSEKNKKTKNDRISDKAVQRLRRGDLLEILIEQSRENETLREQVESMNGEIDELHKKLADRKIKIDKAGTLAEASLSLNGVFDAAQEAAQQYLENLQDLYEREAKTVEMKEARVKEISRQMLDETKRKCDELIRTTEDECSAMLAITRERCDSMKTETKFCSDNVGLRDLPATTGQLPK